MRHSHQSLTGGQGKCAFSSAVAAKERGRRGGFAALAVLFALSPGLSPAFSPAFADVAGRGAESILPEGGAAPGAAESSPAQGTGGAASAQEAEALLADLGFDALMPILAQESHDHGLSLARDYFPGRYEPGWEAMLDALYAPEALAQEFGAALLAAFADQPEAEAAARAFFTSASGRKMIAAETGARRLLRDPDEVEAAEVLVLRLRDARSPRLRLYRDVITAGDLVERNLAFGLTSAAAFSEGLAASGPATGRLPEAERLAQIWRQEDSFRTASAAWLMSFGALAWQDLPEADLKAYQAFLASDAGQRFYTAVFLALDQLLVPRMQRLGYATGEVLQGRQI